MPGGGFANMTPERRREICAKGGRNAHASGRAHRFTSSEASAAGKKSSRSRKVQADNGRKGGYAKARRARLDKLTDEFIAEFGDA